MSDRMPERGDGAVFQQVKAGLIPVFEEEDQQGYAQDERITFH